MNKDFRIALGFFRHPKTNSLRLRFPDVHESTHSPHLLNGDHAIACLLRLWSYTAEHFPDGHIWGSELEIESQIGWLGQTGALFAAILDLGFIVPDGDGYQINDWDEHNPWCVGAKEREKLASIAGKKSALARKQKARAVRELNGTPTEAQRNANGTPTDPPTESQRNGEKAPTPSPSPTTSKNTRDEKKPRRVSPKKQPNLPDVDGGFGEAVKSVLAVSVGVQGMTPAWAKGNNKKHFAALKRAWKIAGTDLPECWRRFLAEEDGYLAKGHLPVKFVEYLDRYRVSDREKRTQQKQDEYKAIKNQDELAAWEAKWVQGVGA